MADDCLCYFGRGKVYLADAGTTFGSWGFAWGGSYGVASGSAAVAQSIGNASDLVIRPKYKTIEASNYSGMNSAATCSVGDLTGVDVSFKINCFSDNNIKQAFLGNVSVYDKTSSPVTGETINFTSSVKVKDYVLFRFGGVNTSTVVVRRYDGANAINLTLVNGTDYVADAMGITFRVAVSLGVGEKIKVDYTYNNMTSRLEAFTQKAKNKTLVFVGMNLAGDQNKNQYVVMCHKVQLSPTSQLQLINSDNFSELEISGTLMPDVNITDTSLSQYFYQERIK